MTSLDQTCQDAVEGRAPFYRAASLRFQPPLQGGMERLLSYLNAERGRRLMLAAELGISQAAISQWSEVPVLRVGAIERFTGIPRSELRPDIFGAEESAVEAAVPTIDVKLLRTKLGWCQERMARYLGLNRSCVSRMEAGQPLSGPVQRLLSALQEAAE